MPPPRHTRAQVQEAIQWREHARPFLLTAIEALQEAHAMPLGIEQARALRALGAAEGALEALDHGVDELKRALERDAAVAR